MKVGVSAHCECGHNLLKIYYFRHDSMEVDFYEYRYVCAVKKLHEAQLAKCIPSYNLNALVCNRSRFDHNPDIFPRYFTITHCADMSSIAQLVILKYLGNTCISYYISSYIVSSLFSWFRLGLWCNYDYTCTLLREV